MPAPERDGGKLMRYLAFLPFGVQCVIVVVCAFIFLFQYGYYDMTEEEVLVQIETGCEFLEKKER